MTKRKPGRPTDFQAKYCDISAKVCARGATIAELAEVLGVNRCTIYRWAAQHPEFGDTIRIAKEIADERVGFSLYERAVGYTYDAVKIMQSEGSVIIQPYREHCPPDVNAAKTWLFNRQGDKWRDRQEHEHTGQVRLTIERFTRPASGRGT
jgi:transcriptional regulator with XRE-family HTH domain